MRCPVLLALTIAVAASAPSAGRAGVILPGDPVAGVPQPELAARWLQWTYSFPDGANPAQDATGAFASLGDQGPYFFLAGSFDSNPVTRAVTVRSDQPLFFSLTNAVSIIPFFGNTEAEIRQDAADTLGVVSGLSLTLDGAALPLPPPTTSLLDYRQETPPGTFDLTFPANAVFGVPQGTYQAVGTGYWVGLTPLAPGSYQLRFTARSDGTGPYTGSVFTQDITYNLVVTAVPEPSGLVLLGLAGVVTGGYGLLRRVGRADRRLPGATA
jgi:hypothetical protein